MAVYGDFGDGRILGNCRKGCRFSSVETAHDIDPLRVSDGYVDILQRQRPALRLDVFQQQRRIGHAGSHFSPVSFSEINLCRTDVMDRRPAVIVQLGSCQMRVDISYGAEQQVAELTGVEMLV